MSEKERIEQDEENVEAVELDNDDLEDASGGINADGCQGNCFCGPAIEK